jgi:hypothetical protein
MAHDEDAPAETAESKSGPIGSSGDEIAAEPSDASAGERVANGADVDAVVEQLLLGLKAEEPSGLGSVWAFAIWAGAVLGLVGIAIGVWGLTVLLNQDLGSTGKVGGMVLMVMSMTFMGIGAWMGYRALRQQGVL